MVNGSDGGPKNSSYTALVSWVTSELKELLQLEEQVNAITDAADQASFCMEVSAFLKELGQMLLLFSEIFLFSLNFCFQEIIFRNGHSTGVCILGLKSWD